MQVFHVDGSGVSRMRTVSKLVAVGVVVAGMVVPAAAADASAPASGASVVVQQNGVTTNHVCASQDVVVVASGFSAGRTHEQARVEIIGSGELFSVSIPLTAGSGSVDTGSPGPDFVGLKFRVRYEVGSSGKPADQGSFSATIFDC
jgi:hypothetical protein